MPHPAGELPFPPFELADRVLKLPNNDLNSFLYYEGVGRATKEELIRLLPEDFELRGKRMLDFGCGAGRTLRHFMAEAESNEIWGADIDERSIEWLEANLSPPLHVARCEPEPPVAFESESVDFAWAISVFTHLTSTSAAWLLELHRILKPGGLLMASYMGRWNSEVLAGEPWVEDRIGMNVIQHDRPWDLGGPMVLMSDWWVSEHWGRAFEIVARNDSFFNQTWLILRKKPVTLTPDELLAPSDDPREWRALRHNLEQLQREIEATAAGRGWSGSHSPRPRGRAHAALGSLSRMGLLRRLRVR